MIRIQVPGATLSEIELEGLALGVGQVVQSLGQLGRLDRSVDPGLDLSELIGIVVELDPELLAGREFDPSAAVVSAHQVARDSVTASRALTRRSRHETVRG
jgi:hypothetical protein